MWMIWVLAFLGFDFLVLRVALSGWNDCYGVDVCVYRDFLEYTGVLDSALE